ncbi:MAG: putative porin [Burkholderiales bacterium]
MKMRFLLLGTALALPAPGVLAQIPADVKPPTQRPVAKKKPVRTTVPTIPAASPTVVSATDAAPHATRERRSFEQLRDTTLALIRLMVQEGVLSKEKASRLLGEAQAKAIEDVAAPAPKAAIAAVDGLPSAQATAPANAEEPPKDDAARHRRRAQTVRVPYVPESVKGEIRDQIKQEVLAQAKAERWAEPNALPEWLDRIAWDGDLRLRYEGRTYAPDNTPAVNYNTIAGANLPNTRTDEGLWRYRMRLGVIARSSDAFSVGVRLTTGRLDSPVSTNSTLGRGFQADQIVLDRAYGRWDPSERWSVMGGRVPNPWFWPTDLVWDEDLNFDGVAGTFRPRFSEAAAGFGTVGVFPLEINTPSPTSPGAAGKWLYGAQGGIEWQPGDGWRVRLAAGLFDYRNVEGRPNRDASFINANDWTAPRFRQKGNSVVDLRFDQSTPAAFSDYGLASRFKIVNLSAEIDLARWDPLFVKLSGDYVRNIGFDRAEILRRTGLLIEPRVSGYQARLTVGREAVRGRGDWQAFVGYRYVERDAVVDAFTDSDFRLGGTDGKGYTIGALVGVDKNVTARLRYLSSSPISGPASGIGPDLRLPLEIDVLQADLNLRF